MERGHEWKEGTNGRSARMEGVHEWKECTNGRSARMEGVHECVRIIGRFIDII